MNEYTKREVKWNEAYYGQLVGARITGVEVRVYDEMGYDEVWVALKGVDRNGEAFSLEIAQDAEGNGPGFLFGLPNVQL